MLNAQQEYVNVISRHQVIQKDKNGKAWMIMGVMDLSPDQTPMERIKRTIINRKTGEILASAVVPADQQLIKREKEILLLIRQGFLSKEIAYKLNLSIYMVNNHRKNILAKLKFYKKKNVLYFVFVAVIIILKNSMKKCLDL